MIALSFVPELLYLVTSPLRGETSKTVMFILLAFPVITFLTAVALKYFVNGYFYYDKDNIKSKDLNGSASFKKSDLVSAEFVHRIEHKNVTDFHILCKLKDGSEQKIHLFGFNSTDLITIENIFNKSGFNLRLSLDNTQKRSY